MIEEGSDVLYDLAESWQNEEGGLEDLIREISAQDSLDAQRRITSAESDHFDELENELDIDFDEEFGDDLRSWAKERLQFREHLEKGGISYFEMSPNATNHPTLLPVEGFIEDIRAKADVFPVGFGAVRIGPLAFDRMLATKECIPLCRIGHPFIDGLAAKAASDDRGLAWAFWRQDPERKQGEQAFLYFRFDYLIETDLSKAYELCENFENLSIHSLRRRADEFFPPHRVHLWIDQDLNIHEESELPASVSTPYEANGNFRDYNLNASRWLKIESQPGVDLDGWENLCSNVRDLSEKHIRVKLGLSEKVKAALDSVCIKQKEFEVISESRKAAAAYLSARAEASTLEIESAVSTALMEGISNHVIRPDSVGAIFVSSNNPY